MKKQMFKRGKVFFFNTSYKDKDSLKDTEDRNSAPGVI